MSPARPRHRTAATKSAAIAASVLLGWAVLAVLLVGPWFGRLDRGGWLDTALGLFAAFVCWIMLLWAFHHLAYQIAGLFYRPGARIATAGTPPVAILYTTRDDFSPTCCRSCLEQDYPEFRVLVCDDSETETYQALVAEFCREYPDERCQLLRRDGHAGFKAGNLNHALDTAVREDWILLVDADQDLPPDYLRNLMSYAPPSDPGLAFVQGAQEAAVDPRSTPLQDAMAPGAASFCQRDLPLRNGFGFVPMLGHGTLIPTAALREGGGFPAVVSEDFAFAMQAARRGRRGLYVRQVVSQESFPHDFPAFVIRLRKYASGTAELFRREIPAFLFWAHPGSLVERWDLLLMLGWYALLPLLSVNGFVAAYVGHRFWTDGIPIVSPLIPYLFTWLVLATWSVLLASAADLRDAWRHFFWSAGLYAAVLPLASVAFVRHLFVPAAFDRTPKHGRSAALHSPTSRLTQLLGASGLVLSVVWLSPYSFVLAGQSVAYLSFPLYAHLCADTLLGRLARAAIYVPGLLFLAAIAAIWYSASTY